METRANHALIGLFTLAVITTAFMFVYWFSGGRAQSGTKSYEVVFSSSVSGLSRGAQVLFNGLRVGEVVKVELVPNDPGKVAAQIDIDSRTPVKEDTKVRLEFAGLTGVASIALTGGSTTSPNLVGQNGALPTLRADSSDFQNVLEAVQRLAGRADDTLGKIDRLITENSGPISSSVRNVENFTKALSENADGVKAFMSSISSLGKTIEPVVANLQDLTKNINDRVKAIDTDQLKSLVDNASKLAGQLDKLVTENASTVSATLKNVESFSQALAENRDGVKQFISSVANLGKTLEPVIANIEKLTKDVSARVDAVDPGRVKSIVENADSIAATLRGSADKLDKVLSGIDNLLGSGDTKSVIAEISEAARAFRTLSENLDKRTRELTASIKQFTGPGLRQYEALANDGRRTLEQLNRTVRSIERNPQQFIFGSKPSIPEYSGR
jgi:phospholipid/cholesterol/gamma-HCH transport system substrate-binding protein